MTDKTHAGMEKAAEKNAAMHKFKVFKSDDEEQLVFGWANIAIRADGDQEPDLQGDVVDPDVLEKAAYRFVEFYRVSGEMHNGEPKTAGVMIESVVFTQEKMEAMGIPPGIVPEGWWIGFHVLDPDVWEKVKNGQYSMFSIEGDAIREEIPTEHIEI